MDAGFYHSPITLGTNTASALSLVGQVLSLGDVFVQIAGDTMTGPLFIDGSSDTNQLKIQNNGTQTNSPFRLENPSAGLIADITASGRYRIVSSTSSGILWGDSTMGTTNALFNHTGVAFTLTNNTGTWSFEGAAESEFVFNNLGADVNFRIESDTNANIFMIDAGLMSGDGGIGIGTNAQAASRLYIDYTNAEDANNVGINLNVTQTTSRSKTLRGLQTIATHSGSGTQTGMNGLEFTMTASGTGTITTTQGVSANANIGATATMTTLYLFRAFAPTITAGGTLTNFAGFRTETIADSATYFAFFSRAGRIVFNDDKTSYSDFTVKGDNDDAALIVDVSADAVGVGLTTPTGKLHVDQSSTTAAKPVLTLDQADLSEEFIRFVTTVGAGNPIDTAALGTYYGKARVHVEGVGAKFIALYNT